MSIKEKLAQKMASKADYLRIMGDDSISTVPDGILNRTNLRLITTSGDGYIYNRDIWWACREYQRLRHLYDSTEVLDMLFGQTYMSQHFVHVSRNDPKMIAYTPSVADGEADKQVTTTLGKLLRKYFLHLTDKQIQNLEQEHAAELSTELTITTDRDRIAYVYQNMVGDSGCMRKSPGYYGNEDGIHPSAVYSDFGLGVAYLEVGGSIKARSVVYINPDNPNDKRFVRIYGAPVLKKQLERSGFKLASLDDVKLPKITYRGGNARPRYNNYVMPYIDGAGGSQSLGPQWVIERADHLELISNDKYTKLRHVGVPETSFANIKTTSGCISLNTMPDMTFVCAYDGRTYDMTEGYSRKFVYKDGTVHTICANNISVFTGLGKFDFVQARDHSVEPYRSVDVAINDTHMYFSEGGVRYLECPENRKYLGHVLLSTKYYPPNTHSRYTRVSKESDGDHHIRRSDSVALIPETGDVTFIHVSHVPELRKQGYRNCATLESVTSELTLIHKKRKTMARTASGTRFDTELYTRFVKAVDGKYYTKEQTLSTSVLGMRVYYPRSTGLPTGGAPYEIVRRAILTRDSNSLGGLLDSITANPITEPVAQNTLAAHVDEKLEALLNYELGYACQMNEANDLVFVYDGLNLDKYMASIHAIESLTIRAISNSEKYILNIYKCIARVRNEFHVALGLPAPHPELVVPAAPEQPAIAPQQANENDEEELSENEAAE